MATLISNLQNELNVILYIVYCLSSLSAQRRQMSSLSRRVFYLPLLDPQDSGISYVHFAWISYQQPSTGVLFLSFLDSRNGTVSPYLYHNILHLLNLKL